MLIPYINLTLMKGHPLNKENNILMLDYGYLKFEGVALIKMNNEFTYDDTSFKYALYKFEDVGGININTGHYEEIKILYERGYLLLPKQVRLSDKFWIPINTPSFSPNLGKDEVKNFFSLHNLNASMKEQFV